MSPLIQPLQPYYNEFLRCAICFHDFEFDNDLFRPITLPSCGHTMCGQCINILRHQNKCPQDQVAFGGPNAIPLDQLPTNYPILILLYDSIQLPEDNEERYAQCYSYMKLDDESKASFHRTQSILAELAVLIKPIVNEKDCQAILSRPMMRKIFSLFNCQFIDREGRWKALKAARSLGERACVDLILHHQNPQQLTANLWSAVRSRGCQFLGPAMQEEVLKLILLALEDGSALSRKVLVLFVVQKLAPQYPRASKTSVGHVVQLLYRASCFKVQKREEESSLMQLKSEFRNYESLRREHDSQIIQIAMEAGLRISPEQWSSLLYGDTQHKSSMQSIIDKLSTPASFSQAIQEFLIVLQRAGDVSKHLAQLKSDFDFLSQLELEQVDPQNDTNSWSTIVQALQAIKVVLQALIEFNWQDLKMNKSSSSHHHHYNHHHHHHHQRSYDLSSTTFTSSTSCSSPTTVSPIGGSSTTSEYQLQPLPPPGPTSAGSQNNQVKYKVSMCRDFMQKHSCPRGVHCTFAHSKAEMDKYRAKSRQPNGSMAPPPPLPVFTSPNLIRPLWNPPNQSHMIQEVPQQHHHHHYYHSSQIPPSILQLHGHPPQPAGPSSSSSSSNSQIPVIAAAAQAILEQSNAANAFYRFQQQQQQHQHPSMAFPPPSRSCLPNNGQGRVQNYPDARFSSLVDQHPSNNHFPHIEDLRLPPVLSLSGNNPTDHSRNYSVHQSVASKTDDNHLYFPSITRPNTSFVNHHHHPAPASLFTDILSSNPNQRQAPSQKSMARNDENVFQTLPHPGTNFDDEDYSLINVSNPNANESSFFYFGSGNAHGTAAYNFYHPNSPLGGNGHHSLKA